MTAQLQFLARQVQRRQSEISERSVLMGEIAWELLHTWQAVKSQKRKRDFLEMLVEQSDIIEESFPRFLQEKGKTILDRRQPSLSEAIRETAKRFLFVETFLSHIPDSVSGVALGGSMAYGPFFNLRGGPKASDLDIFCVVTPEFFTSKDPQSLIHQKKGFSAAAAEAFFMRTRVFHELYKKKQAQLMSIKAPVGDFVASIKFLPCETFVEEFDTGFGKVLQSDKEIVLGIKDYKQGPYFTSLYTQYSFSRDTYPFYMHEEYPKEGGAIINLPQLIISKGHVYTGQHHNHFIPRVEVCYDKEGLTAHTFKRFNHHLSTRLLKERERSGTPDALQVINALDRKPLLSPQMLSFAHNTFP